MTDLAQDFDLLRETAREAASLALSYRDRPIVRERKPDGSIVTEADKAVDRLVAARLKDARPDYGWLSEESLENERRLSARRVWILDPIDGTREFLHGGDGWTIALCLAKDGVPVLSAVVNPVRGEFFEARVGMGAFLNGQRILASAQQELSGARVVVSTAVRAKGKWQPPWPGATPVSAHSFRPRGRLFRVEPEVGVGYRCGSAPRFRGWRHGYRQNGRTSDVQFGGGQGSRSCRGRSRIAPDIDRALALSHERAWRPIRGS